MQTEQIHEAAQPLAWLIGKWNSIKAEGSYPTIKSFTYSEVLEFTSLGQPMLNYRSVTRHPTKGTPMHLETGFLRIKPGTNQVAFMVAHNFGLTSLEEGLVIDKSIRLKSKHISRMSFAKEPTVTELDRNVELNSINGHLEVVLHMATTSTALTEHLKVVYTRQD